MPKILHAIIVASYFVLASAIALLVPQYVPAVTPAVAPFLAGLVFLGCAFAHYAFAQSESARAISEEMNLVRRQTREIAQDILSTQTQA